MLSRLGEIEADHFERRIYATAIVNNAIIRCSIVGLPISEDNVIKCVGDFFDPSSEPLVGLIDEILSLLHETLRTS